MRRISPHQFRSSICRTLLTCVAVNWAVGVCNLPAAEPSSIRRLTLPLEQLNRILTPDWQTVTRTELEGLLEAHAFTPNGPRNSTIVQAEYSATITGDRIHSGILSADIQHPDPRAALLVLDPLNLTMSGMRWEAEGPAAWGSTPSGRTAVLVNRPRGTLAAHWTLQGRRLSRSVEFDIQIAPASVSRLTLKLDQNRGLRSSAGQVTRSQVPSTDGTHTWTISLGRKTGCRLTVDHSSTKPSSKPLVLADRSLRYSVRDEGVRIQADFQLNVLNGSIQQLQMSLPAQITVYAITYGTDTKLSWQSTRQGAVQKLNVRLPDELSGVMRPIRVEGFARVELEQAWELPQITMADTIFHNGQVVLDVVKPLTVRDFNTRGLQQTKAVMDAANQESFTFQQYLHRSHLQAVIGLPNQIATATVFTHFDLSGDDWTFASAVNWLARSGTQFRVGCQIAPGWKITDVAESVSANEQKLVFWNTQLAPNGELNLSLEFADALDPKTPRTIVIRGERTAGLSLHHFQLPTVFPTGCQRVDSAIAISPSTPVSTREQKSRSYRAIEAESFPEFATESNLWQSLSSPLVDTLLLMNASVDFKQPSIIDVGKATSAPQATVEAHLDARQIVEQFKIMPDRRRGDSDRLLVFLTAPGPQPKWMMQGAPSGPLPCRQIPFDQLKKWSLPPGGELWEVTLPSPELGPITILGIRTRPTNVTTNIALPFLPGSDAFRGRAALMFAEAASNVTVDQIGLQSQTPISGEDSSPDADAPIAQRWSYTTPRASLAARRKADPPIQQVATMSLSSHIVNDRESDDIHLALFHLQSPTSARFRFKLPEPAQLISTEVNGHNAYSIRDGDHHVLRALAPDSDNSVAIRYRTPAARSLIRTNRRIVVPRIEQNVIQLQWSIALPDGAQPIRTSPTLRLLDQPTEITWTQRLFGNLGRATKRPMFDLLSKRGWQTALTPDTVPESTFPVPSEAHAVPSSAYSQWTVVGNVLPAELILVTVDSRQCRQCSWIALLGGAVVVLLMRARRFRYCSYIVGLWITACLVTAALATPEMSMVVGSSLTGVVIAGLVPQTVLRRLRTRRPTRPQHVASTVRYSQIQHTSLLLLLLCGWESLAQESTPLVDKSETVNSSRDILLPQVVGDENQQPQVGYVHQSLLRQLRDNLSTLSEAESYLIQSSQFDCDVRGQSAIIKARFRVVILDDQPTLRIHLPIAGANVGGSDACRVNGEPTPILKSTTRPGYEIIVSRAQALKSIRQTDANPPPVPDTATATKTTDGIPKPTDDGTPQTGPVPRRRKSPESTSNQPNNSPTTVEIELALYPPTKAIPGGAMFEIKVPPVMATVMHAAFDQEYAFVSFSGSARTADATPIDPAVTPDASQSQPRQLTVDIGKRRTLWLRWSTTEPAANDDAVIQSSVHCLVDIAPSHLQYDYTFDFQARSTQVDYLTFQLPTGSRVLNVDSEQLLSFSSTPQPTHEQLLVEFTQAQTANFSVSVSLILPLETQGLEVPVPCAAPLADAPRIEVLRRVVQMTAQSPFELKLKAAPPSSSPLDQEQLSNGRKSDYAFEVPQPAVFTFQLERRRPRRRVYQTQEAWIGANRIDWFVSAEIKTDETPAFQHTLWLDPRLAIESVSVIEDGAERMVRWNREADRLTLFLSSKTTGLQNLTLTAHLPRNSELSTRLPIVRLLDAVTLESYLTLSHAEDLSVDILDPQHLKLDESKTPQTSLEAETLVGRYVLADSDKMPRIQTTNQQSTAIADTFTIVSHQQQIAWQLSTLVHFRPDSNRRRLKIRIPSVLKDGLQIDSSVKMERQLVDEPDGTVLLLIAPSTEFEKAIDVTISAPVNIPPDGQWKLPQLTLVDCQRGDRLLGLSGNRQLTLGQAESTSRQITSLPEWASQLPTADQASSNLAIYRVHQEPTQPLLLRFAASDSTTHLISLVTTHLQFPDSQRVNGQTTIYVASRAVNHNLRMQLPSATAVRAVVINGTTYVKPIKHSGSAFEIALDDVTADASAVVDLYWTRDLSGDVALLAQIPVAFPIVTGASPGQSLLLLDQPPSHYCAARNSLRRLLPADFLLRQSSGLLDVCRLQSLHKDRDRTAWRRLVAIQSVLRRQWGFAGRTQMPLDATDDVNRKRWNDIQTELVMLQPTTPAEPQDAPAALSPLVPSDRAILASLPKSGGKLSLWIVNVRNVLIVCMLLVVPVCVWLVHKLLHTKMAQWIMSQPGTPALILGTVWWLALEPSVLGLPLVLLGGARMIQHLTRPAPAPAA